MSTSAVESIALTPKKFVPPKVGLGDSVVWKHASNDGDEAAAIVVKVGNSGALGLVVFAPDSVRGLSFDGVLHTDDPRNAGRQSENGVWRLTDRSIRLNAAINALADNSEATGADFQSLVEFLD